VPGITSHAEVERFGFQLDGKRATRGLAGRELLLDWERYVGILETGPINGPMFQAHVRGRGAYGCLFRPLVRADSY
jgi:hypothetical protein